MMANTYACLAAIGLLLPLSQLFPWLVSHGLDVKLLIQEAFGSPISAFAWLDVIVSAVVLVVFIFLEGHRLQMKILWIPVIGTFAVGVSFGLPLFLMFREKQINKKNS